MPRATVALLAGVMLMLAGCLVSSNSNTSEHGTKVPENTFEQIQPGQTTMAWVQATLGEPNSKSNDANAQVWCYSYTQRTDSSGAVFLIFGGSSSSVHTSNAYVEFKNGVVSKKWRD